MPSFCRHGRFENTCPICAPKAKPAVRSATGGVSSRPPRPAKSAGSRTRRPAASSTMSVRRMARAADDGYEHGLVPGLRASEDAQRLADELAFAAARLRVLGEDPPGLYAEVAAASDPLEAAWLAVQIVALGPLEDEDPFAGIAAVRTDFASGELPDVEGVERGPRAAAKPEATLKAFRAWLARPDALAAEVDLPAGRRFDRLFERLGMPGWGRAQRYELLVLAGALGVADVEATGLWLGEATDPTMVAAKRVFAIGDVPTLGARASALAEGAGVPMAALDLALVNWNRPPNDDRITTGVAAGDPEAAGRIAAALGLSPEPLHDGSTPESAS